MATNTAQLTESTIPETLKRRHTAPWTSPSMASPRRARHRSRDLSDSHHPENTAATDSTNDMNRPSNARHPFVAEARAFMRRHPVAITHNTPIGVRRIKATVARDFTMRAAALTGDAARSVAALSNPTPTLQKKTKLRPH